MRLHSFRALKLQVQTFGRFCRILFLVLTAFILRHPWNMAGAERDSEVVPPDYRFKVEVLARGMPQPLLLHADAEGRIFFNELGGKLKIWKPGGEVLEAASVPVFDQQENGFLGFALDPGFAQNHWIYLLYSPTNFVGQRLSRFVMDGDRLDSSSEKEIFRFSE